MANVVIDFDSILNAPKNVDKIVRQVRSRFAAQGIDLKIDNKLVADFKRVRSTLESLRISKKLQTDIVGLGKGLSAVNKEQQRAKTLSQELGQQTAITAKRFSVYLVASRGLNVLGGALKNAATEAIAFDREFLKIRQTLTKIGSAANSVNSSELELLEKTISKAAISYGASGKELVRASQFFAQAGRTFSEIQSLVSAIGQASLTPTFEGVEKSAENLEAILRQFNLRADQGAAVLDSLNNVAKNFNVQVNELFTGVQKAGSAFATLEGAIDRSTGDPKNLRSLQDFIGLFTSVISVSRESADVIGTAFKTVAPRLQRQTTRDYLKDNLGIDVTTAENDFIGFLETFQKIDQVIRSTGTRGSNVNFAELAEQIGGSRNFARVIPLITQVANAQKAQAAAANASGSVAQDVAIANENLSVQIAQVREEFEALARELVKTGTFKAFADTILELSRNAITLISALKPLIPLLTTFAAIKLATGITSFGRGFSQRFNPPAGAANIPGFNSGGQVRTGYAKGGSVILTPGEGVLSPRAVNKYPGKTPALERLNRSGTGSLPSDFSIVPGTGNSDTVPANLPPGSFVIKKSVTQKLLSNKIKRLNRGGSVGGSRRIPFASGGEIPGFSELSAELRKNIRAISNVRGLGITTGEIARISNDLKKIDFKSFGSFSTFLSDLRLRLFRASEIEINRLRTGLSQSPKLRGNIVQEFAAGNRFNPTTFSPLQGDPALQSQVYRSNLKLASSIQRLTIEVRKASLITPVGNNSQKLISGPTLSNSRDLVASRGRPVIQGGFDSFVSQTNIFNKFTQAAVQNVKIAEDAIKDINNRMVTAFEKAAIKAEVRARRAFFTGRIIGVGPDPNPFFQNRRDTKRNEAFRRSARLVNFGGRIESITGRIVGEPRSQLLLPDLRPEADRFPFNRFNVNRPGPGQGAYSFYRGAPSAIPLGGPDPLALPFYPMPTTASGRTGRGPSVSDRVRSFAGRAGRSTIDFSRQSINTLGKRFDTSLSSLKGAISANKTGLGFGALAATSLLASSTPQTSPVGAAIGGASIGGIVGFQAGGPIGAALGALGSGLLTFYDSAKKLEKEQSVQKISDQLEKLGQSGATSLSALNKSIEEFGSISEIINRNDTTSRAGSSPGSGFFGTIQGSIGAAASAKLVADVNTGAIFKDLAAILSASATNPPNIQPFSVNQDALRGAVLANESRQRAALNDQRALGAGAFQNTQKIVSDEIQKNLEKIFQQTGKITDEDILKVTNDVIKKSPAVVQDFGLFSTQANIEDSASARRNQGERDIRNIGFTQKDAIIAQQNLNNAIKAYAKSVRSLNSDIDALNSATDQVSSGIDNFSNNVSNILLKGTGSAAIGNLNLQNRFSDTSRLSNQELQFSGGSGLFNVLSDTAKAGERLKRGLPDILSTIETSFGQDNSQKLINSIIDSPALKGIPTFLADAIENNILAQASSDSFSIQDVFTDPDKFFKSLQNEFSGAQQAISKFNDVVNKQVTSIAAAIDQRVQFEEQNNKKLGELLGSASAQREFQISARGGDALSGFSAVQDLADRANTARSGRLVVGGQLPNVAQLFSRNRELESRRTGLLEEFQRVSATGGDTTNIVNLLTKNSSEISRNNAALAELRDATKGLSVINSQLAQVQQNREASRNLLVDLFDPAKRNEIARNNAGTSAILGGQINSLTDKQIQDSLSFAFSDFAKLQLEANGGLGQLGFKSIEEFRAEIARAAGNNLQQRGVLNDASDISALIKLAGTAQGSTGGEQSLIADANKLFKIQQDVIQQQFALGNAAVREIGKQIQDQQKLFSNQLKEIFESDSATSLRDAFNRLSDKLGDSKLELKITEAEINVNIQNAEVIAKAIGRDLDGPLRQMIKQEIEAHFR